MSEQTETTLPELASSSKPSVVKILVVDDDVIMRNVLSRLLKNLGYEAKTASGGRQALDLLMEEDFHLMLVDVMMPEMDGFSLIRVFRQASSREIPVIMMSGSEDPDTVSKVFQSGAEDFLPKPIKEEILRPRIQKCLDYRDRKIRERYYKELMKEEKRLKKELNERIEKNMKEIEEYKKQVAESIETPMQIVMSTINDLMSGKYESEQYKIALVTILKSLGSSDLYKPAFVDYIKKANMDHNTRNWLVSQFTRDGDEAYIKEGLQKSPPMKIEPTTPKIAKKLSENLPFDLESYNPTVTLKSLDYNTVDFENNELKKHVLYYFKDLDFYNLYGVSPFKLWNMLGCLENVYKENHYHNFKHAMDVTQYAFFLVTDEKISELLSPFNKFCLLVSALCHDIDHPGMNNNFLMNTRHELALIYNDKSVLENHHAACAFQILSQEKYNILENLSDEQYREFRKTVVSVVLSTDMANHFSICSKFETRISTGPLSKENPEDHMQLMKILMKCADINNSSRPFNIAKKWANMCIQEFLSQGDKEKALSLPVSPLMDRNTLNFPKSQIDFTDFIAIPLFTHLTKAFPHLGYILNQIQDNRKTWKRIFDEQEAQKNSQTQAPVPQPAQQSQTAPPVKEEKKAETTPAPEPLKSEGKTPAPSQEPQVPSTNMAEPVKPSNGKQSDYSVAMLIIASIVALAAVIIFAKFR